MKTPAGDRSVPNAPPSDQHDNRQPAAGSNTDPIVDALDAFCQTEEQSYDEMMQSFTYLRQSDVRAVGTDLGNCHTPSSGCSELSSLSAADLPEGTMGPLVCSAATNESHKPRSPQYDCLEEEVLEEGTRNEDILSRSPEVSGMLSIKVDNFLPDKESDSSDDEDNTITYSASFLSSQDTNKKGVADEHVRNSDNCTVARVPTTTQSSQTKKPTLESLCRQEKLEIAAAGTLQETRQVTAMLETHMSRLRQNTKLIQDKYGAAESKQKNKEPEVWDILGVQSEDEDDTGTCQQSMEASQLTAQCQTDCTTTNQYSSHEVSVSTDNLYSDDSSDEEYNDDADMPQWLKDPPLNPGEIEDDAILISHTVNNTLLGYTSVTATRVVADNHSNDDGILENNSQQIESVCDIISDSEPDDVQQFSLDDDFDYDNIVLTPKFTADEMNIMAKAKMNISSS